MPIEYAPSRRTVLTGAAAGLSIGLPRVSRAAVVGRPAVTAYAGGAIRVG
jgi:hypothetical protein